MEQKQILTKEEEVELVKIQSQLDLIYLDLAKGAFIRSRAKWLEEGEQNTQKCFALEKINLKRNTLSALNINGSSCTDPKQISDSVFSFYNNLYNSKFDLFNCENFIKIINQNIPTIDKEFHDLCDSNITRLEVKDALLRMKKRKAPGIDGVMTGLRRVDPLAVRFIRQRQNQTGNGQRATTGISEAEQRRKQYQAGVEVTGTGSEFQGRAVRGQTQGNRIQGKRSEMSAGARTRLRHVERKCAA